MYSSTADIYANFRESNLSSTNGSSAVNGSGTPEWEWNLFYAAMGILGTAAALIMWRMCRTQDHPIENTERSFMQSPPNNTAQRNARMENAHYVLMNDAEASPNHTDQATNANNLQPRRNTF